MDFFDIINLLNNSKNLFEYTRSIRLEKQNLIGLDLNELNDIIFNLNQPKYRSDQLFQWIYKGIYSIEQMQNIPKKWNG